MAHSPFHVEVLTPEGEVFNDDVEMISTRTTEGSIGILANHTPLLAMLDPAELRLYKTESEVVRFAQAEGYVQMTANRALVLVEEAVPPDELDRSTLQARLSDADEEISLSQEGTERRAKAERDKARVERFLELAPGSGGD